MPERIKSEESSSVIKPLLVLLGAIIFANLLVILLNEVFLALFHVLNGHPDNIIYLHLYEWSFTGVSQPFSDPILERMGPFINIIIALGIFLIFRWKRNHYYLPLLMWAPLAFLHEGYGILTSFTGIGGPWTPIIDLGFSIGIALALGLTFFIFGIFLMFLVLPLPYNVSNTKLWKIFLINIIVFPLWFVISLVYSGFNPSFLAGAGTAFFVAVVLSLAIKPFFPFLNKITLAQKRVADVLQFKELNWSTIGLSWSLAMIMMLIFIFTPYEHSTEKGYVANLITLIIIIVISFIGFILFLFNIIKRRRNSLKIS